MRITAPSSMLAAGIRPEASSRWIRPMMAKPWDLTSHAPAKLMKRSRATVGKAPASLPTLMRRYISITGMMLNMRKSLKSIGNEKVFSRLLETCGAAPDGAESVVTRAVPFPGQ